MARQAFARQAHEPTEAEQRALRKSEGQITDSSLPRRLGAALDEENEILDRVTDCDASSHLEHARHSLAFSDAIVGVAAQSRHIVRDQNATFAGRPFRNGRIVRPRETDILDTNDVRVRLIALETSDDIVVEILVSREARHGEVSL